MKCLILRAAIIIGSMISCYSGMSQSPGLIIDPKNGNGITFLNPNGDKYSSATASGFTTNYTAQSEIQYKKVQAAIS